MIPNEAIILAGGLGTRLQSVVSEVPKPMAPIDDRPFLEYMLSYLSHAGIRHAILSVGYKHAVIKDHFGDAFKKLKLSYAVEEEPLGTGGAVRYALKHAGSDDIMLLNGDTFFHVNLKDLSEFHFAHDPDISMTVKVMRDFFRYGTVKMDVSKVTGFAAKKPVKRGYINGGVYILRARLFDRFDLPEKFSFESDLLEKHIHDLKICAMNCSEYFIDIGIPKDYEKARKELPRLLE